MSETPKFSISMRGYERRQVEATVERIQASPPGTVPVPSFTIVLRGYNRAEVDAYLARHAAAG